MKIQTWTAYKQDPDGIMTRLGTVETSQTGTKEQAQAKAKFKYLNNSLGYKLIIKKGDKK